MSDKYAATWVSHSSINDFLSCPRAYYLNNIYRDPRTRHKIQLISPPLALGQIVHQVVESLSVLPTEERFRESLIKRFENAWSAVSGKQGGFTSSAQETEYKQRGADMLRRVMANPGPLKNLAVKISGDLPHYWLSEQDEIILCGKIDWLEYLPDQDAVHIIDFKTGKYKENDSSLQLPIYHLLVHNTQHRDVARVSYWYLAESDVPQEQVLPDLQQAEDEVLTIAKKIKVQRKLNIFKCPHGEKGCRACRPLEAIVRGDAIFVGTGSYNQDVYYLPATDGVTDLAENSTLL